MSERKAPTCPICGAVVSKNPAFPFCSSRCRTVDLGAWASERYRVPVVAEEDDDGENAEPQRSSEESDGSS